MYSEIDCGTILPPVHCPFEIFILFFFSIPTKDLVFNSTCFKSCYICLRIHLYLLVFSLCFLNVRALIAFIYLFFFL